MYNYAMKINNRETKNTLLIKKDVLSWVQINVVKY